MKCIYSLFLRWKHVFVSRLHQKRINDGTVSEQEEIYDDSFYRKFSTQQKIENSHIIFPIIEEYIPIKRVIDVGCGVGAWSKYFCDKNVYVKGYDFDWVPEQYMAVPKDGYFVSCDLNERLVVSEKFDLVINLEVAEHLKPERAETLIEDLAKLGDVVLFSAAIPYQGGDGHLNEQFPEYWGKLFAQNNMSPIDIIRPKIWKNENIAQTWVKQNLILFVRNELVDKFPKEFHANPNCLTRLFFLRFLKIRKRIKSWRLIL